MIRRVLGSSGLLIVAACAAFVTFASPMEARRQNGSPKTIFVSVQDASTGKPVTDMTAADFAIREDNQDRQVVGAKVATDPIAVYMLADTSQAAGGIGLMQNQATSAGSSEITRDLRTAFSTFAHMIAAANPANQMALMEFGQASITIVKLTSSLPDIDGGINKLFPKPQAPSVLLEAIGQASDELNKQPLMRRNLVSVNVEPANDEDSEIARRALQSLGKSHAVLWSTSLQLGSLQNAQHGLALQQLAKGTGGNREEIVGQSTLENQLKHVADVLTNEYAVTYVRPNGQNGTRVLIGTTRMGVKMFASSLAPK
jgi:hypothetical protein